jgi:hypothetical protein
MIQTLAVKERIRKIEEVCIWELVDQGEQFIDPVKLKQMIVDRVNKTTIV